MSEGSSVLLNMGAELATASGVNTAVAPQTGIPTGKNGEFAAVLKSALTTGTPGTEATPLINSEVTTNPLLFTQLDNGDDPLLKKGLIDPELLPGGKDLPVAEQELAWQAVLSEFDSTDPETPHIIMAQGDENGYELEELNSDDIQRLLAEKNPLSKAASELDKSEPVLEPGTARTEQQTVDDRQATPLFNSGLSE